MAKSKVKVIMNQVDTAAAAVIAVCVKKTPDYASLSPKSVPRIISIPQLPIHPLHKQKGSSEPVKIGEFTNAVPFPDLAPPVSTLLFLWLFLSPILLLRIW